MTFLWLLVIIVCSLRLGWSAHARWEERRLRQFRERHVLPTAPQPGDRVTLVHDGAHWQKLWYRASANDDEAARP